MTPVRRLAMGISSRVVSWSSPGCKEWAEGLGREAAVIESDWAALRWAIGSTRVLLDRRPAPLTSLGEVPGETQKFVEMARRRAGSMLALSIMWGGLQAPLYLWKFYKARSVLECAGCTVIILASIFVVIHSLMERRRLKEPWKDDIYDDLVACADVYKEQLKRGESLWVGISYILCAGLGPLMYYREESHTALAMTYTGFLVGMFLFLFPFMHYREQNNLRRIEEIDALLAERD